MGAGDGQIHPGNDVSVQELFSVSQTAAYPFVAVGNHTQRNHAEQDRRRHRPWRQPKWVRLLDPGARYTLGYHPNPQGRATIRVGRQDRHGYPSR